MKDDLQLRRDVLDELEWEPSLDAGEIGVTVAGGIVTLNGCREELCREGFAAGQAAERVRGVRAIANDIEVRLPGTAQRTDAEIARAAADALRWRNLVAEGQIKVSVTKGWITLEGDVDWQFQRDSAYEAVRHLVGVHGVTNLIELKPHASATEVKSRIESAFRRSAELDARKVQVETRGGKVTLRGDVSSRSERQEAERMAWSAPGVAEVENLILIAP